MRRVLIAALGSAAALAATPAWASLEYNANPPTTISAQGFGNVPRDLTIQGQGSTESGCVSVGAGGTILFGAGSCITNAQVHDSNGFQNTGGDEPNPLADNQKYGIPTLSVAELGWVSAADIGLLFNATEPGGDAITIQDITLKFYNSTTGALIAAIDNSAPVTFDPSQQGNGSAGFVFTVDAAEQTWLNTNLFALLASNYGGAGNVRIALESTLTGAGSGPESWVAFNLRTPPAVPEPATWAMMLLGFGGIGIAMRRKQRRNGVLMQVA